MIEKIKYNGKEYKIKYIHDRNWADLSTDEMHMGCEPYILPKGGTTVAFITDNDGNILHEAYAVCSVKDTYNKRLGRIISTGRLLKHLGLNTKLAME